MMVVANVAGISVQGHARWAAALREAAEREATILVVTKTHQEPRTAQRFGVQPFGGQKQQAEIRRRGGQQVFAADGAGTTYERGLQASRGGFDGSRITQFGGIKQPEVNPSCPNLNFFKDEVRHLRT